MLRNAALRQLRRVSSDAVCQTVADSGSCVVSRRLTSAALNQKMELELPFAAAMERAAEPFAAAIAEAARQKRKQSTAPEERPLFVPELPRVLLVSRLASQSDLLRSVLVVDTNKPAVKPRLSWYNPYDTTWIPSGWFADGLKADVDYYFGDVLYAKQQQQMASGTEAGAQPNGA